MSTIPNVYEQILREIAVSLAEISRRLEHRNELLEQSNEMWRAHYGASQAIAAAAERMEERDAATCSQLGCPNPASHRFTWPGRPRAGVCGEHLPKLLEVQKALGLDSIDLQEEPHP